MKGDSLVTWQKTEVQAPTRLVNPSGMVIGWRCRIAARRTDAPETDPASMSVIDATFPSTSASTC